MTRTVTRAPVQIDLWLERFTPAAEQLQQALAGMLYATLGGPGRPTDVSNVYDLDKAMGSRIHRAAFATTSQDMVMLLPGKPAILRLIERAAELAPSPEPVEKMRAAYERFLEQVGEVASTQQELVTVLSANDPDLMRETIQKQRAACFYPVSKHAGGCADARSSCTIFQPNADDSSFCDAAFIQGYHGLRRLGMMQVIVTGSFTEKSLATAETYRHLDGSLIDPEQGGTTVQELSSMNLPRKRTVNTHGEVCTMYLGKDLPLNEPIDLVDAAMDLRWLKNIRPHEYGVERVVTIPVIPTKFFIDDYMIHRDVWPGIEPVLKAYGIVPLPPEGTYPEDYWYREVPHFDELEPISIRALQQPIREAPKHAEMVRYALEKTNMNPHDYRAYRLMIRYPMLNQPLCVYFSRKPEEKQAK